MNKESKYEKKYYRLLSRIAYNKNISKNKLNRIIKKIKNMSCKNNWYHENLFNIMEICGRYNSGNGYMGEPIGGTGGCAGCEKVYIFSKGKRDFHLKDFCNDNAPMEWYDIFYGKDKI